VFFACDAAWLERFALLTSLPRFMPLSCAIFPQPCPDWCSATMLSKLWPVALANKCAFSSPPQPSPVEALSACSVSTGTPVAVEILSTFSPREETTLNSKRNAAIVTVNVFISNCTPFYEYRFRFCPRRWFPPFGKFWNEMGVSGRSPLTSAFPPTRRLSASQSRRTTSRSNALIRQSRSR
jgi:hypothetical protein